MPIVISLVGKDNNTRGRTTQSPFRQAALCRCGAPRSATYIEKMLHVVAVASALVWVAGNFFLWSLKQSEVALFWQSLAMAAVALPSLHWYMTRPPR